MATYSSLFPIDGSLGGLTFYHDAHGTKLVKQKNKKYKPTSAAIKRNNQELGGGSTMCKHFRHTFYTVSKEFGEQSTCGRLNAIFKLIITHGEGDWGQRVFDLQNKPEALLGFAFQKERSVRAVLADALLQPELNAARDRVRWGLPAFSPRALVRAPKGATHFQLVMVATQISSGAYVEAAALYQPLVPMPAGSAGVARSAYFDLGAEMVGPFVLEVAPGRDLPTPEAMGVVICVGVVFGNLENGSVVGMKDGRALDVLSVG